MIAFVSRSTIRSFLVGLVGELRPRLGAGRCRSMAAVGLLLGATVLGSCAMNDNQIPSASTQLEDPASVVPSGKPNSYLLCPEATCTAPANAASPTFDRSRAELEQAWLALMRETSRTTLLAEDPARHLYLFRQRSAVFGFPDLISVRFLATADGGATLIVYSRSVYGYYDFGVNRRRVEDWVARLEAKLRRRAARD